MSYRRTVRQAANGHVHRFMRPRHAATVAHRGNRASDDQQVSASSLVRNARAMTMTVRGVTHAPRIYPIAEPAE